MTSFDLTIITPEGKIFKGPVESVSVPGVQGSFGVLNRHAPIASKLTKGVVRILQEGAEIFYSIAPGIFEVNHKSEALLLTDKATKASSLAEAKQLLN
ncbi:MAG: ATP synthase F1 subunit epsilon [Candidatus Omnitrophica bacterium]|nr:ATP synthase F1 subunit epsilon [Candidatus Omnitrophota bacterium]